VFWREGAGVNVKKAVELLWQRYPSIQAKCCTLSKKSSTGQQGTLASKTWNPTREELQRGTKFINDTVGELDISANELLVWIHGEIRDEQSDIFGFPVTYVKEAAANALAPQKGADRESFFPLLSQDFNPVLHEIVLPKIIRFLRTHGLFVGGVPGVGKTQWVKMVALLLGRYWIDERGLGMKRACWRRGKKIERFKELVQKIYEMLMLDDPLLELIHEEDMKGWFELVEAESGQGRYNDSKYAKNAPRSLLTNKVNFAAEPELDTEVTAAVFWELVQPVVGHLKPVDRLAVFKRCVSLIAGKKRLYLRLPSEDEDAPIESFSQQNIVSDWLRGPGKNPYLDKFLSGKHETPPGYDEAVRAEMHWVNKLMDGEVAVPPGITATVVPPTPTQQQQEVGLHVIPDSQGMYHLPVPIVRTGADIRSRFHTPVQSTSASSDGAWPGAALNLASAPEAVPTPHHPQNDGEKVIKVKIEPGSSQAAPQWKLIRVPTVIDLDSTPSPAAKRSRTSGDEPDEWEIELESEIDAMTAASADTMYFYNSE